MANDYILLFPRDVDWDKFRSQKPLTPFADENMEFLNALSVSLLKDKQCRLYPDVVTFAFFCRRANLLQNRKQYMRDGELRLGRGLAFHIAPSNVPINFAYSLVAGMLAGNVNVVRVSSKNFPQVDLVVKHIQELSPQYLDAVKRIAVVRYDRTSEASAMFSNMASVRIIWGGDATIAAIRKNELPPRALDVCFADRYSIAAIASRAVIEATDAELKTLAEDFYNDTYLFDQNACSAPHAIFWLDNGNVSDAKKRFWDAVHEFVVAHYELQPVLSVDKLTAFYRQAIKMDIKKEEMPDNYAVRVNLAQLPSDIEASRCAGGYFTEKTIRTLDEIARIVNSRYQTLSYYGIPKALLERFVMENRLPGLDRIVPIGKTTAFVLTWDGYNLIDTLSRVCTVC